MKKEKKKEKKQENKSLTHLELEEWIEIYFNKIKNNTNIPRKYSYPACSFENIDSYRKEDRNKVKRLKELSKNISNPTGCDQWIYLYGAVGNGKTTTAISIAYEIARNIAIKKYKNDEKIKYNIWNYTDLYTPIYMINVSEALNNMMMNFNNYNSSVEKDIFDKIKMAKVLIFDDIFTSNFTFFTANKVQNWINYRYNQEKMTIFTSNVSYSILKNKDYDLNDIVTEKNPAKRSLTVDLLTRTLDRIHEYCKNYNIEFTGNSFR